MAGTEQGDGDAARTERGQAFVTGGQAFVTGGQAFDTGGQAFVTGASGFVGRALVRALDRERWPRLRCLVRSAKAERELAGPGVEIVRGDLREPQAYGAALEGCELVCHLAARTGKGRRTDFFRDNVEGTKALLEASLRAGVPRFLFVSTVAVNYPDKSAYPYADSKEMAEELVRRSGLDFAIARPTIVLGKGGAAWASTRKLAALPVVPVFGSGRVVVQPIDVDDLAGCLAELMGRERLGGELLELGGPETLSFETLLRRAHRALRGRDARVVHLPLGPLLGLLRVVEGPLRPVLPVTAGQLTAFRFDSDAAPNALTEARAGRMLGVDAMLARYTAR